ncbi:MAG: hypothetical protein WCW17_00375 [Patescibacteria group bacterium]|jgi:hypothetical protein
MSEFTKKEFENFKKKLVKLSKNQLKFIADKVGLVFYCEPEKIREIDYILALDEFEKEDVIKAFNDITSSK